MNFTEYLKEEVDENKNNTILKIMEFFKKNPKPKDKDIHKFAEDQNIEHDKFEEIIYEILGSFFGAGRALKDGITEKDVDPKELEMGIKIEMEHTTNKEIAKRISLDHLAELKTYYTLLTKMESDAGVKH